mmetsp:Transcript_7978/g.23832  ORF Transcript_7978/g.23832 Transcript_7978/m.23832 type:complete len:237 (+) Transcript_7978:1255-1965(+)
MNQYSFSTLGLARSATVLLPTTTVPWYWGLSKASGPSRAGDLAAWPALSAVTYQRTMSPALAPVCLSTAACSSYPWPQSVAFAAAPVGSIFLERSHESKFNLYLTVTSASPPPIVETQAVTLMSSADAGGGLTVFVTRSRKGLPSGAGAAFLRPGVGTERYPRAPLEDLPHDTSSYWRSNQTSSATPPSGSRTARYSPASLSLKEACRGLVAPVGDFVASSPSIALASSPDAKTTA